MHCIINILFSLFLVMPFNYLYSQSFTEIINRGIPGNSSGQLLERIHKDVINEQPDMVIILVGTNDLLNTQKLVSVETLVSPPTVDPIYLYQRHDSVKFGISPIKKLEQGRDAMKQVCKEKDIPFVDLLSFLQYLNIPRHNSDDIIINLKNSNAVDGVHFTKKGNELLANYIYCHLLATFDLSKIKKIVCFGDSITNGVYMEGAGTSEGDTYPAVLKRLINYPYNRE